MIFCGNTKGISGGGGGGSSYVHAGSFLEFKIRGGSGRLPGGYKSRSIPYNERKTKDETERYCGEGGRGREIEAEDGASGCIQIKLKGFYYND